MEIKIKIRFFLIGLLMTILATALALAVSQKNFEQQITADLKGSADFLSQTYNANPSAIAWDSLSAEPFRIRLLTANGEVLFDNRAASSALDNSKDISAAMEIPADGTGTVLRSSATAGKDVYHYTAVLKDGNLLQMARESQNMYGYFLWGTPLGILIFFTFILFCFFLAVFLTKNLLNPLNAMVQEISNPQESSGKIKIYNELKPFSKEIQGQRKQITYQMKTIEEEKNKLESIIADKTQMERMRQEFTTNVSHELKTPLTSISGYAEMIETGMAKQSDVQGFAAIIHKEAGRLLTLIRDIIKLSEMDEADIAAPMAPVDLLELADECADILTLSAKKHQVELHVEGDTTIVNGNHDALSELVYNLCDNAIRYNKPQGKVWIIVKDHSITVTDTGIGIPAAHQNRIFERFYRVDKSRSKETGGTGLGLAIVKHVAEQHKAKIELHSNPQKGTEIVIFFQESNFT